MFVALPPAESNPISLIPRDIVFNVQLSKLSSTLIFNFNSEGHKQLSGLKYKDYVITSVCDKYYK